MPLRGKAAIVGIGEVPTRRTYPGRTTYSLCAEATRLAMTDAGLREVHGITACSGRIAGPKRLDKNLWAPRLA